MKAVALIGPPGSGKSCMACLTAIQPVHVIDVDRKVNCMDMLAKAVAERNVTYKEIGESLTEDSLVRRLDTLVKDEKGLRPPKGWINFANYVGSLESDPDAQRAKTIVIDSYTQLALHMKSHIQFMNGKSKFVWDDWNVWKIMWTELTVILVDYAKSYGKDLIVTLHERVSEIPASTTQKVTVRVGAKGERQRIYVGDMDVLIAGSIDGAFGLEFGTYFTDVYALRVDVDNKKVPRWVCRVLPDGQRNLRCSVDTNGRAEFPPDFKQIWSTQ